MAFEKTLFGGRNCRNDICNNSNDSQLSSQRYFNRHKIGGQWRFRQEDVMNMLNQENMSSDVRETSKRIVKDFLNEQYTPFSESVSVCTVADVSCSKAHAKRWARRFAIFGIRPTYREVIFGMII